MMFDAIWDVHVSYRRSAMSHSYRLCSMKELRSCYGLPVCRQTVYRWVRAGLFPRPVRLGQARIAFKRDEVEDWISTRGPTS